MRERGAELAGARPPAGAERALWGLLLVVALGSLGGCDPESHTADADGTDAGPDGGQVLDADVMDAKVDDASLPDAGRDADVPDGDLFDGDVLDGDLLDGDVVDAHVSDGAVLDGAVLDGAVLDGGALDGAVLDGGALDGDVSDADVLDAGADAAVDPDDPDGDGVLTVTEVACGTDPNEGADFPTPDSLRGSGTELDPYRICLPQHLGLFASSADVLTAHARLGDDLDMSGVTPAAPIGASGAPFVGVFGGDGFVIDGLVVGTAGDPRAGLFADVGEGGVLEGLVFTNAESFFGSVLVDRNAGTVRRVAVSGTATADNHAGLVVNRNLATGRVEDCSSEGTVTATRSHVGGLVGRSDGVISRSFSTATVTGRNRVGGLLGSGAGQVRQCYATGDVTGNGKWVGGLVGSARDGASVEDGFALGSVRALAGEAGGVLGNIEGAAVLRFVYAQNMAVGSVASGGVLGVDSSSGTATVGACFFDVGLTASDVSCTGLSSADLTMQSSYLGFDFVDVWRMDAGVRPTAVLGWE